MLIYDEDKYKITATLCELLQLTRMGEDIISMHYNGSQEIVEIEFEGGSSKKVNVAMDSGIALIRDVIKGVVS